MQVLVFLVLAALTPGAARRAIPNEAQHWQPLELPKHLWAAGFDAKDTRIPQVTGGPWLTWTQEAESIFKKHYRDVHFPKEGCAKRAQDRGYLSARTDMEWGVTSVLRDTGDQLLYGLVTGRFVAFSPLIDNDFNISRKMRAYESCRKPNLHWLEGCYFEPFTACTGAMLAGELGEETRELDRRVNEVTYDPEWFLRKSQQIWEEMVEARAVRWSPAEPKQMSHEVEAAKRLGMFRAMLQRVAFKPNVALKAEIEGVAKRAQLRDGKQLTVLHVRRTDKSKDFAKGAEHHGFDTWGRGLIPTLTTFSEKLLPWMEKKLGGLEEVFVMSDDWRAFDKPALQELTKNLRTKPKVVFDEESKKTEPQKVSEMVLGNEAWGHRADVGRYILAASLALGERGSHIAGCGSSGVSQLVAQRIGGRLGVEPDAIGIWEDDEVEVEAARSELAKSQGLDAGSTRLAVEVPASGAVKVKKQVSKV